MSLRNPASRWLFKLLALLTLSCLTSCSLIYEQIHAKANEERLLKPGALDRPLPIEFIPYRFRFLGKYAVSHEWPVTSGCSYGSLSTSTASGPSQYPGGAQYVGDIYERDGSVWRKTYPFPNEANLDRYVQSVIGLQSVFLEKNETYQGKPYRLEYREQGFQAMCFQAWVRTTHSLLLRFHKRTVAEWDDLLTTWRHGAYKGPQSSFSKIDVNGNLWSVYESPLRSPTNESISGPYQMWILPIADTAYTFSIQIAATTQSLQHPQAHATMRQAFRQIIESVKIEELTPTIEAELAELKAKAYAFERGQCIKSAAKGKARNWCVQYGVQ